jgi:hypothetical protein
MVRAHDRPEERDEAIAARRALTPVTTHYGRQEPAGYRRPRYCTPPSAVRRKGAKHRHCRPHKCDSGDTTTRVSGNSTPLRITLARRYSRQAASTCQKAPSSTLRSPRTRRQTARCVQCACLGLSTGAVGASRQSLSCPCQEPRDQTSMMHPVTITIRSRSASTSRR